MKWFRPTLFALVLTLPAPVFAADPCPTPDYERSAWGRWQDDDGDCQDARAELLIRESAAPVTFTDEDRCYVATGEWTDPYTGETHTEASDLHVDHLVPLAEAHRSGADRWPRGPYAEAQRRSFYHDPENLVLTAASLNLSKGDGDPAEWLPPSVDSWCWYAETWMEVKGRWGLHLDVNEVRALVAMLETCP